MAKPFKIVFFEVEDWERGYLKAKCESVPGLSAEFRSEVLDEGTARLAQGAGVVSVFIYSKINSKVLDKLPGVKLIATRSTGFDHVDLQECKKRKIVVCNVPYYGENTVAEHTFGLILALSRKIHEAWQRTRVGDFSIEGLRGFDLRGKTLGVVGTGHIGIHVVRIARGFEMNVIAFDAKPDAKLAKKIGFKYVPFGELLSRSDIVTLHVPYNKATHHLINRDNAALFKKGAILINTSRGGIVETDALARALDSGLLGGAGLDVLEQENLIKEERQLLSKNYPKETLKTLLKNHVLLERKNVVITPHIAFDSIEAIERIMDTTVDNVANFQKGKPTNMVA